MTSFKILTSYALARNVTMTTCNIIVDSYYFGLLILIILAGDIEMNPGPRFQCRTCKKYCKAAEKAIKCEDCEKRFHASCVNLGPVELQKIESDNDSWYCSNCKAECSLCSGAVLNSH